MHFAPVRAERTPGALPSFALHSRNSFDPRALTLKSDACGMLALDLRKSFPPFPCLGGTGPTFPYRNKQKPPGDDTRAAGKRRTQAAGSQAHPPGRAAEGPAADQDL